MLEQQWGEISLNEGHKHDLAGSLWNIPRKGTAMEKCSAFLQVYKDLFFSFLGCILKKVLFIYF